MSKPLPERGPAPLPGLGPGLGPGLALGLRQLGGEGGDASGSGQRPVAAIQVQDDAKAGGRVVVHVAGAVRNPGVFRLPAGSRVTDAVERAGGPTADAAVDGINLAARLADGQQIVMPA